MVGREFWKESVCRFVPVHCLISEFGEDFWQQQKALHIVDRAASVRYHCHVKTVERGMRTPNLPYQKCVDRCFKQYLEAESLWCGENST
jgi:hypothetical protein